MYNIYYEYIMTENVDITYDRLDLHVGRVVQISLRGEAVSLEFHNAVFVGAIENECVMLRISSKNENTPVIEKGQLMVVRIILSDGVARFSSAVIYVIDEPSSIVFLRFPRLIKFKLIRKAKRIPVSLPFLASNLTSEDSSIVDGNIEDISSTGAGLIVDGYLGEIDEKISIRFVFKMADKSRYLGMNAVIRSYKQDAAGLSSYGVKFQEDEGDDILSLFGFIFYATSFGSPRTPMLPIEVNTNTN